MGVEEEGEKRVTVELVRFSVNSLVILLYGEVLRGI